MVGVSDVTQVTNNEEASRFEVETDGRLAELDYRRNGKRLVTDGPFAETREQIGGFWIIDVNDLDAAIAIATQIPSGPTGVVEIRPLLEAQG